MKFKNKDLKAQLKQISMGKLFICYAIFSITILDRTLSWVWKHILHMENLWESN